MKVSWNNLLNAAGIVIMFLFADAVLYYLFYLKPIIEQCNYPSYRTFTAVQISETLPTVVYALFYLGLGVSILLTVTYFLKKQGFSRKTISPVVMIILYLLVILFFREFYITNNCY